MGHKARLKRPIAGFALAALAACHRPSGAVEVAVGPNAQQRLARVLGIVRTATPEAPKVLKILFYGQSITQRKWTDQAVAHLRSRYPGVRFVYRNMAIGGFSAALLERTAERDLTEAYPDLIVFHVYGDHRAYERIIHLMRSRTTAEIVIQTDHIVDPAEPLCDEGFHLTLHDAPGCRGFLWLRQRNWADFMSGRFEPEMAHRYGLAIEPQRPAWNAYLRRHDLPPTALMADPPHPNAAGWALMARLFDVWFDQVAAGWRGEGQSLVSDRPLPAGDTVRLRFTGNRLELVADGPLDGKVAAEVDGKPLTAIDGCWQTSRTSVLPGVPDWPAIRQVTVDPAFRRPERWSALVSGLNPAQDHFAFRITGAHTGPDGSGTAGRDFVSPSGRIRIAAKDWVIPDGTALKNMRVPEGFVVTWDRHFVCRDEPAVALVGGRVEVRHVVATGLANGLHEVRLRLAPSARPLVRAIRSYRPPLAD